MSLILPHITADNVWMTDETRKRREQLKEVLESIETNGKSCEVTRQGLLYPNVVEELLNRNFRVYSYHEKCGCGDPSPECEGCMTEIFWYPHHQEPYNQQQGCNML
jgi:hypothetical protein